MRAHPLKVFGQAERSKALIDWIKSRIHDPAVMQKLTGLLKKRGIFKTTVSRQAEYKFTPEQIAEIEFNYAALKPYLRA